MQWPGQTEAWLGLQATREAAAASAADAAQLAEHAGRLELACTELKAALATAQTARADLAEQLQGAEGSVAALQVCCLESGGAVACKCMDVGPEHAAAWSLLVHVLGCACMGNGCKRMPRPGTAA